MAFSRHTSEVRRPRKGSASTHLKPVQWLLRVERDAGIGRSADRLVAFLVVFGLIFVVLVPPFLETVPEFGPMQSTAAWLIVPAALAAFFRPQLFAPLTLLIAFVLRTLLVSIGAVVSGRIFRRRFHRNLLTGRLSRDRLQTRTPAPNN